MFEITEKQREKIQEWQKEQDAKVAELQGKDSPYYGACGGSCTYMFTQTSLGVVCEVRHNVTHETINVTDYESW